MTDGKAQTEIEIENGESNGRLAQTEGIRRALSDRIRAVRKRKGWTLEQLAAASGVSRSMLSQIERYQANPTLTAVYRIAQGLGLALSALLEEAHQATAIEIIRADDRTYHYRLDRRCRWRTLSPLHLEKDIEFHELLLSPGGVLRSPAHFSGTHEFLTVRHGTVRVTTGDQTCELHPGDSAYYPADTSHMLENIGTDDAVTFMVVAYMRD